jgi:hypothetical protein
MPWPPEGITTATREGNHEKKETIKTNFTRRELAKLAG